MASTRDPMASRVAFFYEHAGYSYPTGADEAGQLAARRECAERLARAEEQAASRGWWIGVEDDWDDSADPDDDGETASKLASGELERLTVFLSDENSRVLGSVGSVIVGYQDDPYIRVVGAELAEDVLSTHQECHARTTCGNCGHAWCGVCDPAPSALCHWCHGRGWSDAELAPIYEEMTR